jgi:hypothetical protein
MFLVYEIDDLKAKALALKGDLKFEYHDKAET